MAQRARLLPESCNPDEAAALRVLFEFGTDWFGETADFYGIKQDYTVPIAKVQRELRDIAKAKWPLYGRQFLGNRGVRPDQPQGSWALKQFGLPK